MGMKQNEMKRIARLMSKAFQGEKVIEQVLKLRKDFTEVGYC
jgi:glycine/serine hydroxymethyltransferase